MKNIFKIILLLTVFLSSMFTLASKFLADSGEIDSSFNFDRLIMTNYLNNNFNYVIAITLQSDGQDEEIIVGGNVKGFGLSTFAAVADNYTESSLRYSTKTASQVASMMDSYCLITSDSINVANSDLFV